MIHHKFSRSLRLNYCFALETVLIRAIRDQKKLETQESRPRPRFDPETRDLDRDWNEVWIYDHIFTFTQKLYFVLLKWNKNCKFMSLYQFYCIIDRQTDYCIKRIDRLWFLINKIIICLIFKINIINMIIHFSKRKNYNTHPILTPDQ